MYAWFFWLAAALVCGLLVQVASEPLDLAQLLNRRPTTSPTTKISFFEKSKNKPELIRADQATANDLFIKARFDKFGIDPASKWIQYLIPLVKDPDGFKSIGHMMQQDPRTFMYFAVNAEHNVLAVVVEGSVESRENYENFDVLLTRWPFASSSKAKVHRGYYRVFNSVKNSFYDKLAGYMIKYPKYTPWLIGHSRGAVVITLLLASIVRTCPQPFTRLMCDRLQQTATLTIFGSPRIGTRAFADHLLDLNIAIQRVTNVIEETPRLPPKALGYLHINNEWWYDGNTLWQCAPSERYETTACNGGTTFSFKNGHPYHLAVLGKPANPGYPEQSNQPPAPAVLA